MFFVKFVKFYRISFLQKTAGRLLPISSNILDISLALLAINQLSHSWLGPPQRAVEKQFTVLVSKMFKVTKVEGNILWLRSMWRTNKGIWQKQSPRGVLQKSVLKNLVKITEKQISLKYFFCKWIEFSKLVYWVWNNSRVSWHLVLLGSNNTLNKKHLNSSTAFSQSDTYMTIPDQK